MHHESGARRDRFVSTRNFRCNAGAAAQCRRGAKRAEVEAKVTANANARSWRSENYFLRRLNLATSC
jgi:hypothetical protein